MSTVTNSLNKIFFRQSATPEYSIASQDAGVVYYGTIVDGGLLIDDSGDGSLLPGPFATLVPYMDGDRVAFVLRSRRPLILSVEGGFGASDEYAGLASIGEVNAEAASDAAVLAQQAKDRAEAASDAFEEFVPEVEPGERILAGLLIAGPEDGYHVELDQTGVHFHSLVAGQSAPVEMLQINTPGTDQGEGNVFALRDPLDLSSQSMSINEAGAGSFSDITSANTVATNNLVVAGRTLDEILWELPRGVVAQGSVRLPAGRTISSGAVQFANISFAAEKGRSYLITALGPSITVTGAGTSARIHVDGSVGNRYDWVPAGNNRANAERVFHAGVTKSVEVSYVLGVYGGSLTVSSAYTDLDLVVRDIGPTPEASATVAPASGDAPPSAVKKTYTKTLDATWLATYPANSYYAGKATQGTYNGTTYTGVIGFPDLTGLLAESTVNEIQVYLYFSHWYWNSGGEALIALSPHLNQPGSASGLTAWHTKLSTGKPGDGWVKLDPSVYAQFKSGTYRGIALIGSGQDAYGTCTAAKIWVKYTK